MKRSRLTHVDARGRASMVDVSAKAVTSRRAAARAVVAMKPDVLRLILAGGLPKGDALGVARIAGIQAAKRTSELIPLCRRGRGTADHCGGSPHARPHRGGDGSDDRRRCRRAHRV